MPEKHAYDVAETARALSVSTGTVTKLLNTTDPHEYLPSARVGTKRLIRPSDIEAWLDRHMENWPMDTITPHVIDRLGCPTCFAAMYAQTEIDRDLCDDCNDRHMEN